MVQENQSICRICGRSKQKSEEAGSMTQWISQCTCSLTEESGAVQAKILVCKSCNRKIVKEQSGRMTQWLFSHNHCKCETPIPIELDTTTIKSSSSLSDSTQDIESEVLIDVPENFPLDRYIPLEEAGSGSGGIVFKCKDKVLKKLVAVKVLHVLTKEQLVAFQQEARSLSKLNHPNIVSILDFGASEDGSPYMVLEWFDGENLAEHLASQGPLSSAITLEVFKQIIDALSYSHQNEIYHRDLKPSNILFAQLATGEIQVRLIDYGVATIKQETLEPTIFQGRTIVGTPQYMSPDQVQGLKFDQRSEIYSLGCVLYEAFTGAPPFMAETPMELLGKHANEAMPEIEVDEHDLLAKCVVRAINKSTEKQPSDRYQSMNELKADLENIDQEKFADESGAYERQERRRVLSLWKFALPLFIVSMLSCFLFAKNLMTFDSSNSVLRKKKKPKEIESYYEVSQLYIRDSTGKTFVKKTDEYGNVDYSANKFEVNDKDIAKLAFRGKIDKLFVSSSDVHGETMHLLKNRQLKGLNMKYCLVTDKGLDSISQLTSLRQLDLRANLLHGRITKLGKLTNMEKLEFAESEIEDSDLEIITNMPNLMILNLSHCKGITGTFLNQYKPRSIVRIYVSHTSFSSEVLRKTNWNLFPKLEHIDLNSCQNLTMADLTWMKKAHPRLDIRTKNIKTPRLQKIKQTEEMLFSD